jgi:hypothetical protein
MAPHWFELLAWTSLATGFASGPGRGLGVLRPGPTDVAQANTYAHGRDDERTEPRDSWWQVSLSDSHCGAGCTLGDIGGE